MKDNAKSSTALILCCLQDVLSVAKVNNGRVPFLYDSISQDELIHYCVNYIEEDDGDPSTFLEQYNYVGKIYQITLNILSKSLNLEHRKSLTVEQWELIIGPWLRIYLESLYYRWNLLDSMTTEDVSKIYVCDTKEVGMTNLAKNRNEFAKKIITEKWNHLILSRMAIFKFSNNTNLKFITIQSRNKKDHQQKKPYKINKSLLWYKRILKIMIQRILELISFRLSNKKAFVINTSYISLFNQLKLSILINRRPVFYFNREFHAEVNISVNDRVFGLIDCKFFDDFHEFALTNLVAEMPTCYLENFSELEEMVEKLNLPKAPEIIFTGSGVESDELIRLFIAKNKTNSSKYIIAQHGGVYGTRLIPTKSEFYELSVSNKWISWGWSDPKSSVVKNGLNIKAIGMKKNSSSKGKSILFVLPNITYISSRLMPLQPLKRIDENKFIVKALNDNVRREISIRPHPNHRNKSYVKEIADGLTISKQVDFKKDLKSSKLFVTTNNSTTFLESISADHPSVLILLGRQKFIRDISKDCFLLLEKAGIVFSDKLLAVNHINKISENPTSWWNSSSVQEARVQFCKQHSNNALQPMKTISNFFNYD